MKIRTIAVAIGLSLALSGARANDVLEIAEVGENFSDIRVTLNGAPVAVMLTGAADNWTIEFPAGFDVSLGGREVQLGEPENPLLFNSIFATQPTFITWTSDILGVPGTVYQNPITLPNTGSFMNNALDMVFVDRPGGTAPDTSSTLILLGMSLAGLAYFAKIRRSAP